MYLLDTDTLSHLWANRLRVVQHLSEVGDNEIGVTSTAAAADTTTEGVPYGVTCYRNA